MSDYHVIPEEEEVTEVDIIKNLSDRKWRLNHLYYIKNAAGKKVLFKMNPVQEYLHDHLWYRNVIPKARKLGISTFFCIFDLDQIIFSKNKTAGIIAHRLEDQKKLFRNNILFAVENLHPWMKHYVGKLDISTANEIRFKNGGEIYVSLTTRGQTPQFLHISELGYICRHAPDKAEEIVSGSINSVMPGSPDEVTMVSIESTADNGRSGAFYDITMEAERARMGGVQLTELDWKIFFFPWFLEPKYQVTAGTEQPLRAEMIEYFAKLQRTNDLRTLAGQKVTLTPGQKLWYEKTRTTNRDGMYSQFPSTLDEAFSVSLEGAYYASDMNAVYAENRIGFYPIDPNVPVDTCWDLGVNDTTSIEFYQSIGPEIRFVDFYQSSGVGLQHYTEMLRKKGYRYGKHILPHDVQVRDLTTGFTRLSALWDLGLTNTVVAPKLFISDGIEKVRLLFPRFRFNKETTGPIIDALQSYRRTWNDKRGVWDDTPFHGPESNIADGIRMMAAVWTEEFGNPNDMDYDTTRKDASGIRITSFFAK